MIVKQGETKQIDVRNQTIRGVILTAYVYAAAVNNPLDSDDFDPSQVTVKAELKTGKRTITIFNDNLKVLGQYFSLKKANNQWNNGTIINAAAASVKEDIIYSLNMEIPFIRCRDEDVLSVQVICGRSTFSSEADSAVSYIEFSQMDGVGYEMGIPQIRTEVIQANITNQKLSLGDNVTNIALLNFDKTSFASAVVSNFNLSSDKLNQTLNFFDLINIDANNIAFKNDYQVTGVAGFKKYPQTFGIVLQDNSEAKDLDRCKVDIAFNGANVAASQNYLCWTALEIIPERIQDTFASVNKHQAENAAKLIS